MPIPDKNATITKEATTPVASPARISLPSPSVSENKTGQLLYNIMYMSQKKSEKAREQ